MEKSKENEESNINSDDDTKNEIKENSSYSELSKNILQNFKNEDEEEEEEEEENDEEKKEKKDSKSNDHSYLKPEKLQTNINLKKAYSKPANKENPFLGINDFTMENSYMIDLKWDFMTFINKISDAFPEVRQIFNLYFLEI